MKIARFAILSLMATLLTARAHADTLITDFLSTNPLNFAFPGSTWATPVNQFQFFTNGVIFGQEILPVSGGNPTVSGGAGRLGLSLDLSGNNALQLTARLLPANQSVFIQVLLFDADGTHERFSIPTSSFNTTTFSSATVTFSSGTITSAGSTPGLDLSSILTYEVQGDYFDLGGSARFNVQFDQLSAVNVVPEPAPVALVAAGLLWIGFCHRFKTSGC